MAWFASVGVTIREDGRHDASGLTSSTSVLNWSPVTSSTALVVVHPRVLRPPRKDGRALARSARRSPAARFAPSDAAAPEAEQAGATDTNAANAIICFRRRSLR